MVNQTETGFKPVTLYKDGDERTAESAVQETELRFNGWRSSPSTKKAAKKPASKPATPTN